MGKAHYVRCRISPGLFKTEFYVSVPGTSLYVDRSAVRVRTPPAPGVEGEGEVLAYLIDERDEQVLVELTGEPVVGGLRTWVPKAACVAM